MVRQSTIDDLRAQLARLRTEKTRIDQNIRTLQSTLSYLDGLGHEPDQPSGPADGQNDASRTEFEPRRPLGRTRSSQDAIFDVLSNEAPLERGEILSRLQEMGVHIGGSNPVAGLSSRLSQDPRFRSIGGGQWGLTDSPVPIPNSPGGLRDTIYEILAAEGPLHRRIIHQRLVERGVRIGGQDPVNNVGAHLSLDSRFTGTGNGFWALTTIDNSPDGEADSDDRRTEGGGTLIPVFAHYFSERYEAQMDTFRIDDNGRGVCIQFQNEWQAPSAAARIITGTEVNGWKFWKYRRGDGTEAVINEFRDSPQAQFPPQPGDEEDEEEVPW